MYAFINESAYSKEHVADIRDFAQDPELGRDIDATILVKWTNQTYHDENLRAMFTPNWDPVAGISRTNAWRHRNRYYDGLIVQARLHADHLDATSALRVTEALQPTGIARRADGLTAFACADRIMLSPTGDPAKVTRTLTHPTFARLHSVEFNADGSRLLTASSSLDLVHELDLDGAITWTFDCWRDTPYNTNKLGQSFYRSVGDAPQDALRNPDPIQLKDDESLRGAHCVIDDPARYGALGLPTNLTPAFINGAAYASDGSILVTSFHRGEGWVIDRTRREVRVVAAGMGSPHGLFTARSGGYMVTDTTGERVRFIEPSTQSQSIIDMSRLEDRKVGLERAAWLQYTTRLAADTYCAVVAPRQRVTLFDPVRRLRRDIPFDPEWGIQLVST